MRVISGLAKGRTLKSLEGDNTRPTADRVKESIFNILNVKITGAVVLDLFAGSGALGIEALSRQALEAYFIEKNLKAIEIIKTNLETVKLTENAHVLKMDSLEFLNKTDKHFDIIFIDPPYASGLYVPSLTIIRERGLLSEDGIIITERKTGMDLNVCPGFSALSDRKYGNVTISVIKEDDDEGSGVSG